MILDSKTYAAMLSMVKCCRKSCFKLFEPEELEDIIAMIEIRTQKVKRVNKRIFLRDRVEGCVKRIGIKGTLLMRFTLGINDRKRVCRQAFRIAHKITRDYLNTICRDIRMKKFGVLPAFSDRSNPALNADPQFKAFCAMMNERLDIKLTVDQKAALIIGNSVEAGNCWAWMKYYFELVGDFEPNTNGEIHLEPGTVADIWEVYKSDQLASGEQSFLDYQQFANVWESCFEHVRIREFKNVQGKCSSCALLSKLRERCPEGTRSNYFSYLFSLHRTAYMGERLAYHERINLAKNEPYNYISIITDGMAQSHCVLPWLKNMSSVKTLSQHIQGVIVHGIKTIFYRTFHNIQNNANLQIHTILLTLENILHEKGKLPDTFFYQIDGGSENTAKAVIFLCELLVAKRVVKKVVLTRLMVGHTHADIDADFGRIWHNIRNRHLITAEEYKVAIIGSIKKKRVEVEDIFVVPQYSQILNACGDPKFSCYSKGAHTQHQFIFEAVESHETFFPKGVKVTYRAFSQDEVCEIVSGEHSTYENLNIYPRNCKVSTFPKAKLDPINQEEIQPAGMFLLRKLPDIRKEEMKFVEFKPDGRKEFVDCVSSVKQMFGVESTFSKEWDNWDDKVIPKTDNVEEYIVDKPAMIRLPLFDRLFTLNNEGNLARESYKAKDIFNKSDILLSEATDSVRRSGKRISVKPRKLQGEEDPLIIQQSRNEEGTKKVAQKKRGRQPSECSDESDQEENGLYFEEDSSEDEFESDDESDDEVMDQSNEADNWKSATTEEVTDYEVESEWIIRKRNFHVSKYGNSCLFVGRTFKFKQENMWRMARGKITDVVCKANDRKNLFFRYFNLEKYTEAPLAEKEFEYISCSRLMTTDVTKIPVEWDRKELTGFALVGRRVQKDFGSARDSKSTNRMTFFNGKVMNYNPNLKLYRINYEDGDSEDLNEKSLMQILRTG